MKRLTKKQTQWVWFISIWCGSLVAVLALSYVIRWMMNIA
jgi:hypothetical protein